MIRLEKARRPIMRGNLMEELEELYERALVGGAL